MTIGRARARPGRKYSLAASRRVFPTESRPGRAARLLLRLSARRRPELRLVGPSR